MNVPSRFKAPKEWHARFASYAKKSGMPHEFADFDSASALASSFFNPTLSYGDADGAEWAPDALERRLR